MLPTIDDMDPGMTYHSLTTITQRAVVYEDTRDFSSTVAKSDA